MLSMETSVLHEVESIIDTLRERGEQVSTMESCTAGLLATMLTNVSGSSDVLKESAVTYSNEAKVKAGVSQDIIDTYGVYSIETAVAMAEARLATTTATWGIGVTGTLGNYDKENKDSQIGVVYYAIAGKGEAKASCMKIPDHITSRFAQKEYVANTIIHVFKLALEATSPTVKGFS